MSFAVKKLNNEVVGAIPLKEPKDTRPVKGWKLFPEINANIFLKSNSIPRLLKVNRHFLSKTIISSQWLNDLHPMSRKQQDYLILFRGHPEKKLVEVHRDANISIPIEEFWRVYKFATEKPFSFLYVDCTTGEFRRNFTDMIEL